MVISGPKRSSQEVTPDKRFHPRWRDKQMNTLANTLSRACLLVIASWVFVTGALAASLFEGREIYLSDPARKVIRIGITGSTSGHNFLALLENARQESISLGKLGYWEKVPDPPSFLRNYDLQLTVKNNADDTFQIELTYNPAAKDIQFRVLEGAVKVSLDRSDYYPTLVIDDAAPAKAAVAVSTPPPKISKRRLFFDFNSFDSDLRKHYGQVKRLMGNPDFSTYFYYYESAEYNPYYFKTYQDTARLDTEKMGLSLEDGTLAYYQKVLENLKALHGDDITGEIILVTRFGKKYAQALEKYAHDIGIDKQTAVLIWSYEDVR